MNCKNKILQIYEPMLCCEQVLFAPPGALRAMMRHYIQQATDFLRFSLSPRQISGPPRKNTTKSLSTDVLKKERGEGGQLLARSIEYDRSLPNCCFSLEHNPARYCKINTCAQMLPLADSLSYCVHYVLCKTRVAELISTRVGLFTNFVTKFGGFHPPPRGPKTPTAR